MMFLFVGEAPSDTATRNGWTWESGRLAAKQLFDALDAAGIPRDRCRFANWFVQGGPLHVRACARPGVRVVAMGRKVERALTDAGIAHTTIVHPAARGAIRRKAVYAEHVRSALAG